MESDLAIKDDIEHTMLGCPASLETWRNFESAILARFNCNITIDLQSIVHGFKVKPKIINEVAIHLKKLLHRPMSIRKVITRNQISSYFDNYVKINNVLNYIKVNKKI